VVFSVTVHAVYGDVHVNTVLGKLSPLKNERSHDPEAAGIGDGAATKIQNAMTIRPMKIPFPFILSIFISPFLIFYENEVKRAPKGCRNSLGGFVLASSGNPTA
jgi:hypothetical protein